MIFTVAAAVAGALVLAPAPAAGATHPANLAAGQLVAQRNCGGCHAVAAGESPFAGAPPFRTLYRRYGPGGLEALLQTGMLADHPQALEEGRRARNPRMPALEIGEDEVTNLTAYLKSLEPTGLRAQ